MRSQVRASVLAATAAVILAGCGGTGASVPVATTARASTSDRPGGPAGQITCDLAVDHTTLAQLRVAAQAVVLFRATGASSSLKLGGVPFTIARIKVLRTLVGRRVPTMIGLRQTGSAQAVPSGGCPPLVRTGHVYLAYITPFQVRRNRPAVGNQYVVVGAEQGLFETPGGTPPLDLHARSFAPADGTPDSSIPQHLSIADVTAARGRHR